MKRAVLGLLMAMAASSAVAKAYFAPRDVMIEKAEVIAVVDFTEVKTVPGSERVTIGIKQEVTATVQQVLKGEARSPLSIQIPTFVPCAVVSVSKGPHLVFLTRRLGKLAGSNWHYSYRPIKDGRVLWYTGETQLTLKEQELPAVLRQIKEQLAKGAPEL